MAVVALIGTAVGIASSWLLSHIDPFVYDLAEFENGARKGLMIAGLLAATDLFYVQGPRGAWLRRLSLRRAAHYREGFGTAPEVRAVLHAGPIVAGDAKLSIVYLGDTLNTAARLEQTAKELDRECLISGDLLRHLELPADLAAQPLGPIPLRGRQHALDTYALEPTTHRLPLPSNRPARQQA